MNFLTCALALSLRRTLSQPACRLGSVALLDLRSCKPQPEEMVKLKKYIVELGTKVTSIGRQGVMTFKPMSSGASACVDCPITADKSLEF